MKMRNWTLFLLTGLLFACWSIQAFAANVPGDDPTRVLRTSALRGAFLEVQVMDTKGRPVSGAKVTAMASDLTEVFAITGPDGKAILDGLPNESKGTVHAHNKLPAVSWDILIESGKENHLSIRHHYIPSNWRNNVCVRQSLKEKLPTPDRIEHAWETVKFQGPDVPIKGSVFVDSSWQELTFNPPVGKGVITLAYTRPWEWTGKPMPLVTDWHLSVYTVTACPRKPAPKAVPVTPVPAPAE